MNTPDFTAVLEQLVNDRGATAGNLFGKRCIMHNGKAFAAQFHADMAFKLGRAAIAHSEAEFPGSVLWDPSGKRRPMKDWLHVPVSHADQWARLALEAMAAIG